MKLNIPAFLLGILLGSAAMAPEAREPARACYQCGTIEAVLPRLVPFGHNAYFAYDLLIRMEKTGHTRRVTVGTLGAMDVGDRVSVMGGSVLPVL